MYILFSIYLICLCLSYHFFYSNSKSQRNTYTRGIWRGREGGGANEKRESDRKIEREGGAKKKTESDREIDRK